MYFGSVQSVVMVAGMPPCVRIWRVGLDGGSCSENVRGGGFRWLCLWGFVIEVLLKGGGRTASWRILMYGLWLFVYGKNGVRREGIRPDDR